MAVKKISFEDINQKLIDRINVLHPADSEEDELWNLDFTKKFVENKNNVLIIGFVDDDPAGILYGYKLDRFDSKKQFLIYEIGVSEKYRRQGIAKTMIRYLLDLLRSEGFFEAWVLTNKSNSAAMMLYSSTGGIKESDDEQMFAYYL